MIFGCTAESVFHSSVTTPRCSPVGQAVAALRECFCFIILVCKVEVERLGPGITVGS